MSSSLPSSLQKFIEHVDSLYEKDPETGRFLYEKEYRQLQLLTMKHNEENTIPAECGKTQLNFSKNRYKDIIAYDETRLHLTENDEGSDYINANYVKDVRGDCGYIAAQGPLPHTVNDFWKMIWEQNTEIIIMLCKEKELNRAKCHRYWPIEGETLEFDDKKITLESQEEISSDYFKRHLLATCNGEKRSITQHHFLGWPDRGVPDEPAIIFDIVINMRMDQIEAKTPPVIHCSAGCGRTGTIIAVDYAWSVLKAGKLTEDFNMYDIIERMREQRPSIVQTPEQYLLVHLAIQALFREHLDLIEDHIYANYEYSADAETGDTEYDDENWKSADTHEKNTLSPASSLNKKPERMTIVKKTVEKLISQFDEGFADDSKPQKPVPAQRKTTSDAFPKTANVKSSKGEVEKVPAEIKKPDAKTEKNIIAEKEPVQAYENVVLIKQNKPTENKPHFVVQEANYTNVDSSTGHPSIPTTENKSGSKASYKTVDSVTDSVSDIDNMSERKVSYKNIESSTGKSYPPTAGNSPGRKGSYTNIDRSTGKPYPEDKFVTKISIGTSSEKEHVTVSRHSFKKRDIKSNVSSGATEKQPPSKDITAEPSSDVYAQIQPKSPPKPRIKSASELIPETRSEPALFPQRSSHTVPRDQTKEPVDDESFPPLPSRNYDNPSDQKLSSTTEQQPGTLTRLKNKFDRRPKSVFQRRSFIKPGKSSSDSTEGGEQSLLSSSKSETHVFRDSEIGYPRRVGKPKGPRDPPTTWKTIVKPGGFVTYV